MKSPIGMEEIDPGSSPEDCYQFGYYTAPVNSADSTDFTGPDKTHSSVLKHAT